MAIPLVIAGIAIFFVGCKPGIQKRGEKPSAEELELAEQSWQKAELAKALDAYGAYAERYPKDRRTAVALHRMGEIYLETERYAKALGFFERIQKEFPDYGELPIVKYQTAGAHFLVGDYERARDEALSWLETYPDHSGKSDVKLLLGDSLKAMGDKPRALQWWLRAIQDDPKDLRTQGELRERLDTVIETARSDELERMAEYAAGTDFAPKIYHRLATVYLNQNEPDNARKAAMSLVRSTTDQFWVTKGRQLLLEIEEALSVERKLVGCLLPLSGTFAIYGEEVLNGIYLGMGTFGAGTEGPGLELVIRDTEGKAEQAVAGVEDLVRNERVMAIIGPLLSKTAVAGAKRAQQLGVPIITLTQKEGIAQEGDMVFRNFLTPSSQVKRLLDKTMDEMGKKRFCILYPESSYGRFFMHLFWDQLEEKGGRVTAVESYKPEETDFEEQIKRMTGRHYPRPESMLRELREKRSPEEMESELEPEEPRPIIDFDTVFIPDDYQKVAMIAPQLVFHDVLGVLLLGTSLWESEKLIEMAGDYIQGAIFPSGFVTSSDSPDVREFVKAYKEHFEKEPGLLAATGYDTIRLVKRVMMEGDIRTRKDFQKELLQCKDFPGVTGKISFNSEGEVAKEPFLLTISGKRTGLLR